MPTVGVLAPRARRLGRRAYFCKLVLRDLGSRAVLFDVPKKPRSYGEPNLFGFNAIVAVCISLWNPGSKMPRTSASMLHLTKKGPLLVTIIMLRA